MVWYGMVWYGMVWYGIMVCYYVMLLNPLPRAKRAKQWVFRNHFFACYKAKRNINAQLFVHVFVQTPVETED